MIKRLKYIFKSLKIPAIDTITTKLLSLVLFITIIPMIAVTNFSNAMLNQSLLNSARYELQYNSEFFIRQTSQEFNKLLLIANLSKMNYFIKKSDNEIEKQLSILSKSTKLDLAVFITKDKKVISSNSNFIYLKPDSNLMKLLNIVNSGEIITSSELISEGMFYKNNKAKNIFGLYNIVFYPVLKGKKFEGILILGTKMINSYDFSNQDISILIKPTNSEKLSLAEIKSNSIIKEIPIKGYLGNIIGYAFIRVNNEKFINPLIQNIKAISVISIISLIVAIIIAALFARTITTPILKLVYFARKLSEGDLDLKVNIKGKDEIAQLANTFNKMAEELKTQEQLRDNFVATLTHDLKVPMLAENQTINYLLKEDYGPITSEQEEVLSLIKSTNNSSLEMVSTLLEVYRYDMGNVQLFKSEFDIVKLVNESIGQIKSLANDKKIIINMEKEENAVISADEREIKRVLHNLISNAIANGVHRGHIICEIQSYKNKDSIYNPIASSDSYTTLKSPLILNDMVLVSIKDDGIGLNREEMPELFKRFSLNKGRKPAGTGLGLYYSYQVINKHNGYIWAESVEGQGSVFKFTLPVA
ncbi:MAG: ATP-binding protein [bacterium]